MPCSQEDIESCDRGIFDMGFSNLTAAAVGALAGSAAPGATSPAELTQSYLSW
jgi:hypothetical protein